MSNLFDNIGNWFDANWDDLIPITAGLAGTAIGGPVGGAIGAAVGGQIGGALNNDASGQFATNGDAYGTKWTFDNSTPKKMFIYSKNGKIYQGAVVLQGGLTNAPSGEYINNADEAVKVVNGKAYGKSVYLGYLIDQTPPVANQSNATTFVNTDNSLNKGNSILSFALVGGGIYLIYKMISK